MTARIPDGLGEVVVGEAAVRAHVARLGAEISTDYAGRQPHLIGVLKGGAVFIADLMRALTIPATMDFISVAPYGTVTSSGVVRIRKDLDEPIEGKDVLVVEGVYASGLTLSYLLRNFETRHPASLKVCAFLAKDRARAVDVTVHYVGVKIPDIFVVGYGLDINERYRNLPYIVQLS